MGSSDQTTRYREYLATFGIAEVDDRLAELSDLDLGNIRFFAYASEGLRLKAAVTPSGLIRPGAHADDDWYGFLSEVPDAEAAAERLAWLETDSSTPLHGLPNPPTTALTPERRPAAAIDPAQWALVTAPASLKTDDGSVNLVAWFLPSGARVPVRWTVTARAGAPALVARVPASYLLAVSAGSAEAASAGALERARRLLASGTDDERLWALLHIGETGEGTAFPDLVALLANSGASANVRLLAAATLARHADPAAVAPLGVALRADLAPEVRRSCAQALGRIGGSEAVRALAEAAPHEPDALVRAEIVHALAAQGGVAHAALAHIAQSDPDAGVRDLARGSLNSIK